MTKFSQTYPTDLKYTEWQLISDYFPVNRMESTEVGNVADYQCNLVRGLYWMPVAHDAQRPTTLADRVWLLSTMEETRIVGAHQCSIGENSPSKK